MVSKIKNKTKIKTKKNKENLKLENLMFSIFENIDFCKQSCKVFIIFSINSNDLLEYRKLIISCNEVTETLDLLQYMLASKSKFSKRICIFSISVLKNCINIINKSKKQNDISKTTKTACDNTILVLEKLKLHL